MRTRLPGGLTNTLAISILLCAGVLLLGLVFEIHEGRSQTMFIEHANFLKEARDDSAASAYSRGPARLALIGFAKFYHYFFRCFTVFLLIRRQVFLVRLTWIVSRLAGSAGRFFRQGLRAWCWGCSKRLFPGLFGQGLRIIVTFCVWLTPIVYISPSAA